VASRRARIQRRIAPSAGRAVKHRSTRERGSNSDVQPCRNAGKRRVFEPRFWRDRQGCVGAPGGAGGARGPIRVEPAGREARWSQGQRRPATGHHEPTAAASSSRLGGGCCARSVDRSRADEAQGYSCSNGATARSVGIHRVRQLVPAHGHSRTRPTIHPSRQGPICAGGATALRCPLLLRFLV
jgi:hypothetical protein